MRALVGLLVSINLQIEFHVPRFTHSKVWSGPI